MQSKIKFYHGTKPCKWDQIQSEGVLWGIPTPLPGVEYPDGVRRYTYLTPLISMAGKYGDVLLEVDYDPVGVGSGIDNYGFNPPEGKFCWQFSVFIPIPLTCVRKINKPMWLLDMLADPGKEEELCRVHEPPVEQLQIYRSVA